MREPSQQMFAWHVPVLGAILLLSSYLGFHHLGHESLWSDELATWLRTAQPTLADSINEGAIDSMWPAYHGGLYVFTKLAGDTEFALRLPSALAQVVAVTAVYGLGRYVYSAPVGLLSAGLMSASLTQVTYSQEARLYAVETAVIVLTFWVWLRLLRAIEQGRPAWRLAAAYGAAAFMVIYLHVMGWLMLALQGLAALIFCMVRRRGLRLILLVYGGAALISIPVSLTVPGVMTIPNNQLAPPASLGDAVLGHVKFAFSYDTRLVVALGVLASIGLVASLVFRRPASVPGAASRLAFHPGWFLAAWYVVPFVTFFVVSVALHPILNERYLLMAQPPVYMLLANAVVRFPAARAVRALGGVAIVAVLLFDLVRTNHYYTRDTKEDFRSIVSYAVENSRQGHRTLVVGAGTPTATAFLYYQRDLPPADRLAVVEGRTQESMEKAVAQVKPDDVWYIYALSKKHEASFLEGANYQFVQSGRFRPQIVVAMYETR